LFAIETHHLSKFYSRGKVKALQDFSLSVEKGKIFGLLGPNGAGKTTFIKLLLGIIHPTKGQAFILGQPVSNYRVHQHIGYLSEKHHFPDFLQARQVLYYFGKMSGISGSQLDLRIEELLELVNLSEWANAKTREFSKGMLQRLGLAHTLINDPQLIFLDEPTDGIDPVGRREIRDLLQLLRDQGKTIFLNSHLLSEVERISDEIAILLAGIFELSIIFIVFVIYRRLRNSKSNFRYIGFIFIFGFILVFAINLLLIDINNVLQMVIVYEYL